MDSTKLHLALDLGNDSLKIAYAYEVDGEVEYGKLTSNDSSTKVAFPALAYFDDNTGEWIYGEAVDKLNTMSFVKVVKIKELLSLLLKTANVPYYDGCDFPKFFFPRIDVHLNNFAQSIAENKTFRNSMTPREVCEGFFRHVKDVILTQIKLLSKKRGIKFEEEFSVSIVHPPKVGKEYINELIRLCEITFDQTPSKVISSTKAIGMLAKYNRVIGRGDSLLIFDMGEEDISVSKVFVSDKDDLYVDGVNGHMEPLHIGGINVDYTIAEYIEKGIRERDTIGTPSASSGKAGHVYEDALITKQYLFMKGIKKAKTILSCQMDDESVFENGAPVGIFYEVYVQRNLSRDDLANALGTDKDTGLASQIAKYVLDELKLPINRGFSSASIREIRANPSLERGFVVLSGGLAETYSLKEYIANKISKECPGIKVISPTEEEKYLDSFSIMTHESSAYSPAVGGAMVALHDDEIKTVLSLSYGTWVACGGKRCLYIFVDRGQVLESDNIFTIDYSFYGTVTGERLYSTLVTRNDIRNGVFKGETLDIKVGNGKRYLSIGNENNDPYREYVKKHFSLDVVAGGDDSKIVATYHGAEVETILDPNGRQKTYIMISQGIHVDRNGRVSPTYRVHSDSLGQRIRIICKNRSETPYYPITASELEIRGPKLIFEAEQD